MASHVSPSITTAMPTPGARARSDSSLKGSSRPVTVTSTGGLSRRPIIVADADKPSFVLLELEWPRRGSVFAAARRENKLLRLGLELPGLAGRWLDAHQRVGLHGAASGLPTP